MGSPLDEIYGGASLKILKDDYISMVDEHVPAVGHVMVRSEWTCNQKGHAESTELISASSLDPDPSSTRSRHE